MGGRCPESGLRMNSIGQEERYYHRGIGGEGLRLMILDLKVRSTGMRSHGSLFWVASNDLENTAQRQGRI